MPQRPSTVTKFTTLRQAAQELGASRELVRILVRTHEIPVAKVNRAKVLDPAGLKTLRSKIVHYQSQN